MKKLIGFLFSYFFLIGCTSAAPDIQEEEPVTKIINECRCFINDESDRHHTEEPDNEEAINESLEQDAGQEEVEEDIDVTLSEETFNEDQSLNHQMTTYTVVAGDTLNRIADYFGVTIAEIETWNGLNQADPIFVGQLLTILIDTHPEESIVSHEEINVTEATINYIMNGQDDKIESERLSWSQTLLRQLDLEEIYQQYLIAGGEVENIENFAQYLTLNAPILPNWEEIVKGDIFQTHQLEITRIVHLEEDYYQTYIETNGIETPHVIVSSRTGYYHR